MDIRRIIREEISSVLSEEVIAPLYRGSSKDHINPRNNWYIYLTPDEEYASNFGKHIHTFKADVNNVLDITDLGVGQISLSDFVDELYNRGVTKEIALFKDGSDTYPSWGWIKPDNPTHRFQVQMILESIMNKFDAIKYYENYGPGLKPSIAYLVLDTRKVEEL